jgi:transcriptional regulator with XRE-family HTH domain
MLYDNAWGGRLRLLRARLGYSQDALAAAFLRLSTDGRACHAEVFARYGLNAAVSLSGDEICRYETGQRRPKRRSTYLLLAWVMAELGVLVSIDAVNDWLDEGMQGWLTAREQRDLFGTLHTHTP